MQQLLASSRVPKHLYISKDLYPTLGSIVPFAQPVNLPSVATIYLPTDLFHSTLPTPTTSNVPSAEAPKTDAAGLICTADLSSHSTPTPPYRVFDHLTPVIDRSHAEWSPVLLPARSDSPAPLCLSLAEITEAGEITDTRSPTTRFSKV